MVAVIQTVNRIQKLFVSIAAIIMGILAVSVFYEVVSRYVFNAPTIWANELSSYMVQFVVFFAMGFLLIDGQHIRVTFLIERTKGNTRKIMEVLSRLLILPYSFVLVYYGYQYTANAVRLGMNSPTLLEVPLWIPYSFIAIGGVLLSLAAICSVIEILMGQSNPGKEGAL